ncbi:OprD family porin [Pseudomonas sp. FME51]|uniref:OprD family porin n=1 Tax=Pseudomonas sp. FME51 TaxID=2742609 RepID=UPI00186777F4|nr:OprD family porin [Pseudomonas sp. FME51]
MQACKLSLIALATASVIASQPSLASNQSESRGFIEDSSLSLLNKNYLFDRDYKHSSGTHHDQREWIHGMRASFTSGYTQGVVGVGVDAHAAGVIKLDSDRNGGNSGTGILPTGSDGKAQDNYSYVGGSLKARISNTELKAGDLIPTNPVFGMGSSRMFFGTAQGFQLLSNEIDRLSLEAGHFTSIRDGSMNTNRDGEITLTYGGAVDAASADYLGGSYQITDRLSAILYAAKLEDIWNQYYTKLNYVLPLADERSLELDFNLYDTSNTGKDLAGKIDNTTWSLSAAYTTGAHRFMLAHQQVDGDEPFDYIGMDSGNTGGSIWLANSIQYSDFNGPNEKSWQLRYDIDMGYYGVPGLSFMARYITGDDIDDSRYNGGPNGVYGWYSTNTGGKKGKHWERDLEARYVVQSGPAKDLSVRASYAVHRDNGFSSEANELRFVVEYPLDIF